MALFQDGQPVFVMHRFQIEGSEAPHIARVLTDAFDRFCVTAKQ
jgi:putative YphP/YqiW family bacilliredoxin